MPIYLGSQKINSCQLGGQAFTGAWLGGTNYLQQSLAPKLLTNLISNGGFESNTTGWASTLTLSRVTSGLDSRGGTGAARATNSKTQTAPAIYLSTALIVTVGHVYYISSLVRGVTNVTAVQYYNNTTALSNVPAFTVGSSWGNYAAVWRPPTDNPAATSAYLYLRIGASAMAGGNNEKTMELDNVVVVDLTAAYGAGNEPTAEQMTELINGAHWAGSQTF